MQRLQQQKKDEKRFGIYHFFSLLCIVIRKHIKSTSMRTMNTYDTIKNCAGIYDNAWTGKGVCRKTG